MSFSASFCVCDGGKLSPILSFGVNSEGVLAGQPDNNRNDGSMELDYSEIVVKMVYILL